MEVVTAKQRIMGNAHPGGLSFGRADVSPLVFWKKKSLSEFVQTWKVRTSYVVGWRNCQAIILKLCKHRRRFTNSFCTSYAKHGLKICLKGHPWTK